MDSLIEVWRRLWRLNVSGNVKTFSWKTLNECLPTRKNLFIRKIWEVETVEHVLWGYSAAFDVWLEFPASIQKWHGSEKDFMVLWDSLCKRVSTDELDWVTATMRDLWMRRNRFFFEQTLTNPSLLIQGAKRSLEMFKLAQEGTKLAVHPQGVVRDRIRWKAATNYRLKLNCDATMDSDFTMYQQEGSL
ncbi:hypothetical protein F2P56_013004 [Juglans regia]|uniref:Uncharacterized protein n=2 Tax=Juglans regia TaxID=51240 RepID=A0A833XKS6_JUGRE|nr:uncharacterized protein LOC108991031 [Juglans regia]KAF5468893.1 hypothetical protein F2P56_013004 [Juglans regia]